MVEYDSKTKGGDCIFCKIANKEFAPLGNGLIYEDEDFMAWLSPFPNTEGFSVVIPKKHFGSDILKMPESDLNAFMSVTKKVAKKLEDYFKDVGRIGVLMEGMGIDHAHIKLFPMHKTEYLKKGEWKQILGGNDSFFEKYPGYIISNDGPKADFTKLEKMAKEIREM